MQAITDAKELATTDPLFIEEDAASNRPVNIFREHWRGIIAAMILVAAANSLGYALTSYMPKYLTATRGMTSCTGRC